MTAAAHSRPSRTRAALPRCTRCPASSSLHQPRVHAYAQARIFSAHDGKSQPNIFSLHHSRFTVDYRVSSRISRSIPYHTIPCGRVRAWSHFKRPAYLPVVCGMQTLIVLVHTVEDTTSIFRVVKYLLMWKEKRKA